jgi:hypothetical protein
MLSMAHGEAELAQVAEAFCDSLRAMREDGLFDA